MYSSYPRTRLRVLSAQVVPPWVHSGLTLPDTRIPFLLVAIMSVNGDDGCLFSVQTISEPSDLRYRITTRDPRYWLVTKGFAYVVFKHVNKS
jgi:hypothetical protein